MIEGAFNKEITYEKIMKSVAKCMGIDVKYEAPAGGLEAILAEMNV